ALIRAIAALAGDLGLTGDEALGVGIVRKALEQPARFIAENAGLDGAVVVAKIARSKEPNHGYNAETGQWGDMLAFGVIDPTKVTRSALQNGASVAGLLLTTEAIVVEKKEKKPAPAGHDEHGPGMGGMGMM
ncbi:MAG: molecular chaperone GroEL, partial [Isosphaeraceae bacterium]|nr:molecular chaperone GroEL [Isosphaeraceae bacterium]